MLKVLKQYKNTEPLENDNLSLFILIAEAIKQN